MAGKPDVLMELSEAGPKKKKEKGARGSTTVDSSALSYSCTEELAE
jgi:hypothetical protein